MAASNKQNKKETKKGAKSKKKAADKQAAKKSGKQGKTTKQTKQSTAQTKQQKGQTKDTQAEQKHQHEQQAENIEKFIADNDSVELTFPWKEIAPLYKQELKKLAKTLKVKGFRKGKVPLNIAEKEIEPQKLINAVLQQVLPEAYREAIKEKDYQPLTEPEFQALSLNKDNDWKVKAIFAQKPEIDISGYKKLVKAARKEAQEKIAQYNQKAETQADSKQAKSEPKKQQQSEQTQQQDPQPLNQEQQDDAVIQAILGRLVKEFEPAIPHLLIKQNTQQELKKFTQQLKQMQVEMKDFLKAKNITSDQLTMQMFRSSLNKLQIEFLINAIAEQENIEAEEEEVEKRIEKIEEEETREKIKQDPQYQSYLRAIIAKQKVLQYLLEI